MRPRFALAVVAAVLVARVSAVAPPASPTETAYPLAPLGTPVCAVVNCTPGLPDPDPVSIYARGEYLYWFTRGDRAPAPNAVPATDGYYGGRFALGVTLDDEGDKAVEVGGFFLAGRSASRFDFAALIIARPFVFGPQPIIDPFPVETGRRVTATTRLYGLDADLRCNLCDGPVRLDGTVGCRYLDLREKLGTVSRFETFGALANDPLFGNFSRADHVASTNRFYGGKLGARASCPLGGLFVEANASVAIGVTEQTLDLNTGETIRDGRRFVPFDGVGTIRRDRFTVVPEAGVNVGCDVTQGIRATVGYNFLFWGSVTRPGEYYAPRTGNGDGPFLRDTDFWAHGITAGLELRF